MAGADRRLLEQIGLLHEHLHRQAGGQHFDQARILRRVVAIRRDADEVIGEQREVVRRQRALVVALEERVVIGLVVRTVGFELGDRHRLDDLGHARQARPVSEDRGRAIVELEFPGRRRARDRGIGIKRLRAEHIERPLDPAPSRRRQLVLRGGARDELRHHREIEDVGVARADRCRERLRLLARGRARERGAPDVGQFAHQRIDQRSEPARLRRLRVARRLRNES